MADEIARLTDIRAKNHGKCGHNMGVDRVHNTWPKLCLMIKCISLPCLSSIHCLSSRSCLGAQQAAINGSAWA